MIPFKNGKDPEYRQMIDGARVRNILNERWVEGPASVVLRKERPVLRRVDVK